MIFENSRYTDTYLLNGIGAEPIYFSNTDIKVDKSPNDLVYTVKAGDRLDSIAYEFYKDCQLKWKILYANPEFETELDIKAGDVIIIPDPDKAREVFYG